MAVFIRRIQIGDDVPLTQILFELGVLVEQSGKRERFSGFRILQRFKWNPTTRVYIRIFPAAKVAMLSALTGDVTITSAMVQKNNEARILPPSTHSLITKACQVRRRER